MIDMINGGWKMAFYTGDKHGREERLMRYIRVHDLTKEDVIVILGDAGFNYSGYERKNSNDRIVKETLCRTGVTIFSIHGNHEMRPETLPYYHEKEWSGGIVYAEDEYPNVIFAKDGEIYDLDGHKAIAIGGAYSVDKYYRLERGYRWFEDEQPSATVKAHVEDVLTSLDWTIDTVITHTCPARYIPTEAFLPMVDQSTVDNSTEEWLDEIESRLHYKHWLCGHWHINKRIDKLRFLMDDLITLDNI